MKMRKNSINQKQITLERERQLAEKRKEFEAEYYDTKKLWEKIGFDKEFPLEPLEKHIESKSKEWLENQLKIPSGIYQDLNKICSEYQQKFMEYTCKLCPAMIEELRQFTSLFDELFGEKREKYSEIFNFYRQEIFDLNYSLGNEINYSIIDNRFLEFDPFRDNNFDYSFRWGEYRLLFNLLVCKLVSPDDSEKKKELYDEMLILVQEDLKFREGLSLEGIDEGDLQNYIHKIALDIIEGLFFSDNYEYFFEQADRSLSEYLKHLFKENKQSYIEDEPEPNVEAFIKLQCELLNWTVRHNIGKDWVLRYAYYFLSEFSKNPDVKVSDIEVGFLQSRSLAAFPFEFRFNGWLAGDESREVYEQRLRESFEDNLARYFHETSNHLSLEDLTGKTRPKDYDLVKRLVRWTAQDWSIEKIVEIDFEIPDNIERNADFKKKVRYLEEELPKFEKYDLPYRKPCGKSLLKK